VSQFREAPDGPPECISTRHPLVRRLREEVAGLKAQLALEVKFAERWRF